MTAALTSYDVRFTDTSQNGRMSRSISSKIQWIHASSYSINATETPDSLRFNSNLNAMKLQVDGLLFKEWLEQGEAKGWWTCDL